MTLFHASAADGSAARDSGGRTTSGSNVRPAARNLRRIKPFSPSFVSVGADLHRGDAASKKTKLHEAEQDDERHRHEADDADVRGAAVGPELEQLHREDLGTDGIKQD